MKKENRNFEARILVLALIAVVLTSAAIIAGIAAKDYNERRQMRGEKVSIIDPERLQRQFNIVDEVSEVSNEEANAYIEKMQQARRDRWLLVKEPEPEVYNPNSKYQRSLRKAQQEFIQKKMDEIEQEKEAEKKKKRQAKLKKRLKSIQGCNSEGFPEFESETYLLAQIIECEAGNSNEDRAYVGSVLINRARTDYRCFKNLDSIRDVLYQGFYSEGAQQYATHTILMVECGIEPSEEALEVAKGLISGEIPCLRESILFQTTYSPNWIGVREVFLPGEINAYGEPIDFA